MAANRAFSKFQYGKESTRGTAVAAAKMLLAQIKGVPVDRKPKFIEDALGVRARSARSAIYQYLVEDTLTVPDLYTQCLPLFFSCGLKGSVTASEVTASQQDYKWTFLPSMTADNSPDTVTLEMGDDTQAFEIEYTMFRRLKFSGEIPQDAGAAPIVLEADYFGRQVTPTTFTGALSIPTATTLSAKAARLYKDSAWANRGTTELTNILRGFEFELLTGTHPKHMGSSAKYFNSHGESYIDAMLTLTLEGISAADTLFDDFQAGTAYAFGLEIDGPQIGTGTNHNLSLYVYGKPELVRPLDAESQGNNLHQVLIHGMYDTTGAQIVEALVTTNSNSI